MLANGTTGQPLPVSIGAQAKGTIHDQVKKWFIANAKNYRLDERGEKTRMYSDAARALGIIDSTAKTYLSPLVNGKS
ncbi:hypothetical protein ACIU1J_05410 [Azospirillum doebereinerae]|uniref:hypothetical protein n=1 Tax=Azospirillum doebereinerae TaxID=92933 RepID=UPI001EE5D677|nr:hypothetical protein [Azospirillum doebereinerae]MCG5240854.1 hypothetical protein [Azospirillum doebereinerae]